MSNYFSQEVSIFHGHPTPESGLLVGYSLIIAVIEQHLQISIPLPGQLSLVTKKHQRYSTEDWQVFTIRHKPKKDLTSHLVFALKYEGVDLYIIKKFFRYIGKDPVLKMLAHEPTGQYTRRIWFLYEWLMGEELDFPDLKTGNYVEIINSELQFPGPSRNSTRHRVKNNLPGNQGFCPLIRKTEKLIKCIDKDLSSRIESGLNGKDKDLIRRTAAFLLLKDSKASFAIEGEYPPNIRARNWGRVIGQAGKTQLTIKEIERLQDIVIGTKKLKNMGIRKSEGFIGEHDRETLAPIPDHISAKSEDLPDLMNGLLTTNELLQNSEYHPVFIATVIAFGFVLIHPLSDGNGRIHRYMIHHILSRTDFANRNMIFPVSAAILNRISEYQEVLESYSSPRVELIEWEPTIDHNVRILNDTVDLYRYFDLTIQAEFLFDCIEETIDKIIPEELHYLEIHDSVRQFIDTHVSLPDSKVDLLIKLLDQNEGILSKEKREKEFDELTDNEISAIEHKFRLIFMKDE